MIKLFSKQSTRVRFAPSPTGPFHMGSLRSTLFNYLFAKQHKGIFVLRIEDTDKERSKKEWEKDIFESLAWAALAADESPEVGGEYEPYRQSERGELYKKYLAKLLKEKKAYYCFCKPEELEAQKQDQVSRGEAPHYTGICKNLSEEEVTKKQQNQESSTIRFIVQKKQLTFKDLVRGEISFDTSLIGDIVIAKDSNTALYNFTVVVDDYEMKITHVIRGEDHISNTPKQILLQEALGFPEVQYAHLPLLLGEDRTKLSKRHGDNSVARFRQAGYLPEATINFLALLGWNPGNDREIFSLQELIKEFSIEKVQKGGAVFNIQKLNSINGYYIRKKSAEELAGLCFPFLVEHGLIEPVFKNKEINENFTGYLGREIVPECIVKTTGKKISFDTLEKIVVLYQDRLKHLSEIGELAAFFFQKELDYPKELLQWKDAPDIKTKEVLDKLSEILSQMDERNWTKEHLEKILMPEAEKEANRGYMLWPMRVALTGKKASAGPFEVAEILGKETVLERLEQARELITI